jgi:hypothetical protein
MVNGWAPGPSQGAATAAAPQPQLQPGGAPSHWSARLHAADGPQQVGALAQVSISLDSTLSLLMALYQFGQHYQHYHYQHYQFGQHSELVDGLHRAEQLPGLCALSCCHHV